MNKVALVTGSGTGIGKGIALELAKAGYDVAVNYNSSSQGAEDAVAQIQAMGRKAVAIQANFSTYDGVIKLFEDFKKHFDRLDLFVNNAGITKKSHFLETTEDMFDLICNVDFKGSYFCMQQASKLMIEQGIEGNIVVISSNNDRMHAAGVSVYGSVKAGLTKLVEHAAIELAKYKIRVNSIAPGWTDTGASRLDSKESTYYKIPLKKWTTPEEIGKCVIFLASDAAASITGTSLLVDNGAALINDKAEMYGL